MFGLAAFIDKDGVSLKLPSHQFTADLCPQRLRSAQNLGIVFLLLLQTP
jgi:hypothetical protein